MLVVCGFTGLAAFFDCASGLVAFVACWSFVGLQVLQLFFDCALGLAAFVACWSFVQVYRSRRSGCGGLGRLSRQGHFAATSSPAPLSMTSHLGDVERKHCKYRCAAVWGDLVGRGTLQLLYPPPHFP